MDEVRACRADRITEKVMRGFAPRGDEPSERLALTALLRQTAAFIGDINRT